MRILITGGFGFVGGRLAEYFSTAGHQIILGSRVQRPTPSWCRGAEVVQTFWGNSDELEKVCRGIDLVVHAAGLPALECETNPVRALVINGVGTARLVRAAVAQKVRSFLYFSTAHVYNSFLEGKISEETPPSNCHPYATSHLAGEASVLWANRSGAMRALVIRLSNAYGRPVDKSVNCWSLVVNDLCRQAVETGVMELRGNYDEQRDFISLTGVCQTIEKVVWDFSLNGVMNLGSGMSMTLGKISTMIHDVCQQDLGFTPEIRWDESLRRQSQDLDYRRGVLESSGIAVKDDPMREMTELATFCMRSFTS